MERFLKTLKQKASLVVLDFFLIFLIYITAYSFERNFGYSHNFISFLLITLFLISFTIFTFAAFGVYKIIIKHIGFEDILKITVIIIVKNIAFFLIFLLSDISYLKPIIFVFITAVELIFIILARSIPRIINHFHDLTKFKESNLKTLIIGAGSAGYLVLKEIKTNSRIRNVVVGYVDDDVNKIGDTLNGIPVYGPIKDIVKIIEVLDVKEVIIAINTLSRRSLSNIVNELSLIHVKTKRMQFISDLDSNQSVKIVDVKIEDLLNREQILLHNEGLTSFLNNEVVLVTGGGGSIGSELCRQILSHKPKKLIIFDIYENTTYELQMELNKTYNNFEVIIGSVYNLKRIEKVFDEYKPTIVFHAAAYKHVPLMEDSPVESLRTNVIGTYNVAYLSNKYKIKKMVLVSTDKAVRPTSIMGASKRYAEHIIKHFSGISKETSYSAVRFGNVLGSNGSVIPLFKRQILDGGPVTVTHKEITRYFMTIEEAVSLILESALYASGGEIFILDMGEPVKILDLAERMIRLSGLKPYKDIDIKITGLRPGEKLFEELLIDSKNGHKPTRNKKIFIENEKNGCEKDLRLNELANLVENFTNDEAVSFLKSIINFYESEKE